MPRPLRPGVPSATVSPHVSPSVGPHAPPIWAEALGAAQPCRVSLTTGGIAPASLQYDRLTPWLKLRGLSTWRATPSSTVYRLACHRFPPWLQVFARVLAQCVVLRVRCPGQLGACSLMCSLGALCCVCGVLGHSAHIHCSARSVRCLACAVSWATWLLSTGVPAPCIVLRLQCPWPLGSSSPVCPLCALCCVRGVLGHWTPVHRCARSVCYSVCCVCGVLGHLASVHRCACLVRGVACAVSWAS